MGRIFRKRFIKGRSPLSSGGLADGLNRIDYAFTNIELVNGHVEWTPFGAPRLIFDSSSGGTSAVTPAPFDITFEVSEGVTTATLSNLYYGRGGVITEFQAGTVSGSLDDDDVVYVGFELDFEDNSVDFLQGTSLAAVSENAAPDVGQSTCKIPLYKLAGVVDSESVRRFSVAVDLRKMQFVTAYL
jgi:hypothetical protein